MRGEDKAREVESAEGAARNSAWKGQGGKEAARLGPLMAELVGTEGQRSHGHGEASLVGHAGEGQAEGGRPALRECIKDGLLYLDS